MSKPVFCSMKDGVAEAQKKRLAHLWEIMPQNLTSGLLLVLEPNWSKIGGYHILESCLQGSSYLGRVYSRQVSLQVCISIIILILMSTVISTVITTNNDMINSPKQECQLHSQWRSSLRARCPGRGRGQTQKGVRGHWGSESDMFDSHEGKMDRMVYRITLVHRRKTGGSGSVRKVKLRLIYETVALKRQSKHQNDLQII